ncbi:unnamed protein product [Rangifer tarandus platyrhynchus]|uniref:Uncharacterized protein n=1 Tax=Rangifer tarandus platyrhynchus TaxID=3082113 RepID=A0AC59Y4A6_RANTA
MGSLARAPPLPCPGGVHAIQEPPVTSGEEEPHAGAAHVARGKAALRTQRRPRQLGSESSRLWVPQGDSQAPFFPSAHGRQTLRKTLAKALRATRGKASLGSTGCRGAGVFSAASPPRWPPATPPEGPQAPGLGQQQIRLRHWARRGEWSEYQPVRPVRKGFGEKVAFHSPGSSFYAGWVLPAAEVGMLVFLADASCCAVRGGDSLELCPLCPVCPSGCSPMPTPWARPAGSLTTEALSFESVHGAVGRAAPGSRRAPAGLPLGLLGLQEPRGRALIPQEEPPAPGAGQLSGGPDSGGCGALCQGSITMYRAILVSGSDNSVLTAWASRIASLTESVVHLVFILMLSKIYVASGTRPDEMGGAHLESERAVTRRASILQFVSFHSPVYTFFFKSRFGGYPGNCHTLLGVRNEECPAGGCLAELAQELLVIMVGKQVINAVQEIPVPALPGQGFRLRSEKRKAAVSLAASQVLWEVEADYQLLPFEGLFDGYLEMGRGHVPQFGFITTFGAACLLSNWVEILLDARQFIRPVAERAQDKGILFHMLEASRTWRASATQIQRCAQPPVRVRAPGAGLPRRGGAASGAARLGGPGYPKDRLRSCTAGGDQPVRGWPPGARGLSSAVGSRWRAERGAGTSTCLPPPRGSHRYQAFREDDAHYSRTYWTLGPPVRPSSRCSRCRGPQDAGPRSHPRAPPKVSPQFRLLTAPAPFPSGPSTASEQPQPVQRFLWQRLAPASLGQQQPQGGERRDGEGLEGD